jgi:hypothetical protein
MEAASFVAAVQYTSLCTRRSWTKSKGQPRDRHQESQCKDLPIHDASTMWSAWTRSRGLEQEDG